MSVKVETIEAGVSMDATEVGREERTGAPPHH
jgi:hypothetical protein